MNRAVTVFLGLLVIAAVVTLYFVRPSSSRDLEQRGGRLFDFDPVEVQAIRVQSANEVLEFKKEGDTWTLGPRIKDRAAPQAVIGILQQLQNLEVLDAIPASQFRQGLKSSEFGLSKPKLTVQIVTARGTEEMRVGKDGVDEDQVFVRLGESEDTYLVQDTFRSLLTRPLESFRDPRLTDLVPDRVEKIQIRRGPSEIELRRDGANWLLQRPLRAAANSARVDEWLGRLLGARILRFLSDPDSPAFELGSEDQPEVRLWPEGASEPLVLRLLGPGPQMEGRSTQAATFASRDARIYLADEPLRLARANIDELRDPLPLRVNPDLVDRIRVTRNDATETFARSGETDWKNGDGAIQTTRVAALLQALGTLRIQNFAPVIDAKKPPQMPDFIELQLAAYVSENTPETTAGAHPIGTLWVGRATDGRILAKTDQAAEFVELNAASWEALAKSASQLPPETANPTPSPKP